MGSNTPVGADPAELTMAGLQKDFWAKYQSGQITLDHFRWLLRMSKAERDRLAGSASAAEGKFVLRSTFSLTVPTNFVHETQIASFLEAHRRQFSFVNEALTDKNFAKATQRLVPGKTYQVKIFGITSRVTSEDCLDLYKVHNGILTGAQGLTLAWQEARGTFPVGKWTVSFDEKDALWTDSDGNHRVPGVYRYSDVGFELYLVRFEDDWGDGSCILVFCDC